MEREIEGKIESWSKIETGEKKDSGMWANIKVKLTDNPDNYIFFADDAGDLSSLTEKAPTGSVVKFLQWKKDDGKFWNFKKGSFTVLELGDGKPVITVQQKLAKPNSDLNDQQLRVKAMHFAINLECHNKITHVQREQVANDLIKYFKG